MSICRHEMMACAPVAALLAVVMLPCPFDFAAASLAGPKPLSTTGKDYSAPERAAIVSAPSFRLAVRETRTPAKPKPKPKEADDRKAVVRPKHAEPAQASRAKAEAPSAAPALPVYQMVVSNRCAYPVRFAIYYHDGTRWVSRGWWNIGVGEDTVLGGGVSLINQPYYYRFEAQDGTSPLIGGATETAFPDTFTASLNGQEIEFGLGRAVLKEYAQGWHMYLPLNCAG